MADVNLGNVVFCVAFITMFTFLLATIPVEFYTNFGSYRGLDYPAYLRAHEIAKLAYWDNDTLVYESGYVYFNLNTTEWKASFAYLYDNRTVHLRFIVWRWWIFEYSELCQFEGYNVTDVLSPKTMMYLEDAQANWYSEQNASKFIAWSASSPIVDVWITDANESRYDLSEAWFTDGELSMTLGMGFDSLQSAQSAWSIVAKFLTFQPIGDMPIWITYPINVVFWVSVGYLIYCLILKALPFVD